MSTSRAPWSKGGVFFILSAIFLISFSWLSAQPINRLHFDTLAAGTRVDEQFANLGIHFINDYQSGQTYRSSPQIQAHPNARTAPNVLVNNSYDSEIFSSINTPMAFWFDQPVTGVGMWLGSRSSCSQTIQATISLYDCHGSLMAQQTVSVSGAFNTPIEVDDPTGMARYAVIDYGASTCPEAVDELAWQNSGNQCVSSTAPQVTISSPQNFETVNTAQTTINGKVVDSSGMLKSVKVNGISTGFTPISGKVGEFTFSHVANLKEGGNAFTVLAVNAAGNKGSATVNINRGTPATLQISSFHLSQRGVLHNKTCDVDNPLVAGKSAMIRLSLNARTASGAPTYVSQLEMKLWRKSSSGDIEVSTFLGEIYSAIYAGFDSPTQMSGIHFWIPGDKLDPAGEYKFTFQAYVGIDKVGPLLTTNCGGAYLNFSETKPLKIFALPVEAGIYSSRLQGTSHQSNVMNQLDVIQRVYPVRDGFSTPWYTQKTGIKYEEGSPLDLCDGSAGMQKSHPDLCKGNGFTWKFLDQDAGGELLRADAETVTDPSNPNICGNVPTLGGRVKSNTLINRAFNPDLGVYLPGAHPGWKGAKFQAPLDQDHDGAIDNNDLTHYISEFFDAQSQSWSTNLNFYDTGETFRFFQDQDGNHCNDRFGEPQADIRTLWENQQSLYWGPAQSAMKSNNKTWPDSARRADYASLWIPDVLVAGGEFGNIGPGQGNSPGSDSWVRLSANTGLAHELGHNVGGLGDLYDDNNPNNHNLQILENPWMVYVGKKSYQPKDIHDVMGYARGFDRVAFHSKNYKTLFDKLKLSSSSSTQLNSTHPVQTGTQLLVWGRIPVLEESPDGILPGAEAELSTDPTTGMELSPIDPTSPFKLVFGRGEEVLQETPFSVDSTIAPPEGYDSWPLVVIPFRVIAPLPAETDWIELRYMGTNVLARTDRTSGSPEVTLVGPQGGAFGPEDGILIEWEAQDPDSPTLRTEIFYSPDGGENWQLVDDQIAMTPNGENFMGSYLWYPYSSPGTRFGNGRLRVIVSDGFNQGADSSEEAFEVARKPPVVTIFSDQVSVLPVPVPGPAASFLQCERPWVRAAVMDPEQGPLEGRWLIDDSPIRRSLQTDGGAPSFIQHLDLPPLPPGEHHVALEFLDIEEDLTIRKEMLLLIRPDSDCDGMGDDYEEDNSLDPGNPNDLLGDRDGDGLLNSEEAWFGTSSNSPDTDSDSMPDRWEAENGLDPLRDDSEEDPDRDGFSNREEYENGSDPYDAQSPPPAEPEGPITYPQLALGGGYEAVLIVTNMTEIPWNGTGYLRHQNGAPWPGEWDADGVEQRAGSTFDISIPAQGTRQIILTGDSELRAGYLQLDADEGGTNRGLALSFFYNLSSEESLVDSVGVAPGIASRQHLFPVERARGINTGFAWAPAQLKVNGSSALQNGTPPSEVELFLFNREGELIRSRLMPFEGHFARFFNELFEGIPQEFVGKLMVEAAEPFHLTVLRLQQTRSGRIQLTSIPPNPLNQLSGPGPLNYSQLALGAGYQLILMISNNGETPWNGYVELVADNEESWPSKASVNGVDISEEGGFDLTLRAHETRKYVISGDRDLRDGYLRIRGLEGSSARSITPAFFYNYSADEELIDSTGVAPGQAGRSFVFPVARGERVDTGFAWSGFWDGEGEPEPMRFDLTLRLFDQDGNQVAVLEDFPFEGHLARFAWQVFPDFPDEFIGKVQIEAPAELLLTVLRLEMTSPGFQLTAIPAALWEPGD